MGANSDIQNKFRYLNGGSERTMIETNPYEEAVYTDANIASEPAYYTNAVFSNAVNSCNDALQADAVVHQPLALVQPQCSGCKRLITDRYLLKVADELWHEQCLECSACGAPLTGARTCYFRNGKTYCASDYFNVFAPHCTRCNVPVHPTDMVYRCSNSVFHTHCLYCVCCQRMLQKGEQFVHYEGKVVCLSDYEMMMTSYGPSGYKLGCEEGMNRKSAKRPRTILTSSQRRAFKESFEISAKPCRKVREALAKDTGLSVRVVQVWFQNQRAKMKKIHKKLGTDDKNGNKDPKDKRKHEDSTDPSGTDNQDVRRNSRSTSSVSLDEDSSRDSVSSAESTPIDKLFSMQNTYFSF